MKAASVPSLPFIARMTRFAGPALLDQALVSGMNFAVALYISRTLGLAAFGQFSLVLIIAFFCLEIQRALITAPMMSLMAQQRSIEYQAWLQKAQKITALCLGVGTVAFIAASELLFPKWMIGPYALLAGLFVIARMVQEFMRRYFFVTQDEKKALSIDVIATVLIVIGLVTCHVQGNLTVSSVLFVHIIAYLVSYIASRFFVSQENKHDVGAEKNFALSHWQFGSWLLAAALATYAATNLLLLTGSGLLGPVLTGSIKTAQYMMGGLTVLYQGLENIIPARLSDLVHKGEWAHAVSFFKKLVIGVMLAVIGHGLFVIVFRRTLIEWLVPGHYQAMSPVVLSYVGLSILIGLNFCGQNALRALRLTKKIFLGNCIAACIAMIMAYPVIIHAGIIGVLGLMAVLQLVTLSVYGHSLFHFWKKGQS